MSARRPVTPVSPVRAGGAKPRAQRNDGGRPASSRPAGREARSARTPSAAPERPRSSWPRVLTMRSAALAIVVMLAFVMLFPTVRAYFSQTAHLQALRDQVATATERNEELEYQRSRFADDAYVASQARERLAFVYPGETAYRVLDPETVEAAVNPGTGKPENDGPVDVGFADTPWYSTIWNSLEVAGDVAVDSEDQPGAP